MPDRSQSFTPGPWRYNPDFDEVQVDNGLGLPILAKMVRGVEDAPQHEEGTANGLLMAAAPGLLQCLESILHGQPETGTLSVTIGWLEHERIRSVIKSAYEGDITYRLQSEAENQP